MNWLRVLPSTRAEVFENGCQFTFMTFLPFHLHLPELPRPHLPAPNPASLHRPSTAGCPAPHPAEAPVLPLWQNKAQRREVGQAKIETTNLVFARRAAAARLFTRPGRRVT